MTISELKRGIEKKNLKKLYLLHGSEKTLIKRYLQEIDPDYKRVETIEDALVKVNSANLFGKDYTYVLMGQSDIDDRAVEVLLEANFKHRLILVFDAIDKRKSIFKKLESVSVEFNKLSAKELVPYINEILNKEVSGVAGEVIAERCNCDLGRVELECDKLNMLGVPLTDKLIDEIITPYPEDVIFEMVNAVAIKRKKLAYDCLEDLIELKTSPVVILTLLYRNFRSILQVQGYSAYDPLEVAAKTGMVIGQVYAVKRIIGVFSMQQLLDILRLLQDADVSIKTGKMSMTMALQTTLLNILSI